MDDKNEEMSLIVLQRSVYIRNLQEIITVWDLSIFLNRVILLSHEQWNDYEGEEAGEDYEDRYLPTHNIDV